jgi:hypothetical protein
MFSKDDGPMVLVILFKLSILAIQLAAMRFHHLANWFTFFLNFEIAFFEKVNFNQKRSPKAKLRTSELGK